VCSEALYSLLFIVIVLLLIPILGCLVALSQAFVSDFLFLFPVTVIELPAAVTVLVLVVVVAADNELVVVTTAVVIEINF